MSKFSSDFKDAEKWKRNEKMDKLGNHDSSDVVQAFTFKKPKRKPVRQRLEIEEKDEDLSGGSDETDVLWVTVGMCYG